MTQPEGIAGPADFADLAEKGARWCPGGVGCRYGIGAV